MLQRFIEGFHAKAAVQTGGYTPAQDKTCASTQNRRQIDKPMRHGDIRNIRGPDLVGALNRLVHQQVGIYGVLRVLLTDSGVAVCRHKPHEEH